MDILLFCIEVMMNVFAMTDLWLILYLLFGCDMKMTVRNILTADLVFAAIFVVISIALEGHNTIIMGYMCLYNVLVTILLCNSRRIRAVLLTVPAILVYSQFGSFVDLIEKLTGLNSFYLTHSTGYSRTVFEMLSDMLICLVLLLLLRTRVAKSKSIQLTIGEGIVLSVFCMFSPVIVIGLEWFEGLVHAPAYRVVWVLFMIILNVAVVYGIAYRKRAVYYKQMSEDYKKEFEAEYSLFKDYKEKQQDTIKFRHDWKNHMLLLQEMMEKEEYEKAECYFKELTKSVSDSTWKVVTGNELVDMILATKSGELEEYGIILQCKGDTSPLGFMKQVDLLILLSNLLDNAIEANAKVEGKRYICMKTRETGGACYLELANPMEGRLKRSREKILTTKEDKESHGIGLSNVYDIIASYHGKCQTEEKHGEYKIKMVFPLV